MKRIFNRPFFLGILYGVILTFSSFYLFNEKYHCITCEDDSSESYIKDKLDSLYGHMTQDEFDREMEKGVQGDLTNEEYEKLQLRFSLENRDVSEEHINNWEALTDSEKIDALMYDYMTKAH